MTSGNSSRDAEVEQASSALSDGLKTCRSVLNDYRAILSGDATMGSDAQGSDGRHSLIDVWRTQEDSNL